MIYCIQCGTKTESIIPPLDNRLRDVCPSCNYIHYVNPNNIVGIIASYKGKVLLCKRNTEPRMNYWTVPAGFMENGETSAAGAARETREEAAARATGLELYRIFDVPHISQVYLFYRCQIENDVFGVGPESLESALFNEEEIPWDELAFPVVREILQEFLDDRLSGQYPIRNTVIEYPRR